MRKRKQVDNNLRVYVRLSEDELTELDEIVERSNEDISDADVTRASLVRGWIRKGLSDRRRA